MHKAGECDRSDPRSSIDRFDGSFSMDGTVGVVIGTMKFRGVRVMTVSEGF